MNHLSLERTRQLSHHLLLHDACIIFNSDDRADFIISTVRQIVNKKWGSVVRILTYFMQNVDHTGPNMQLQDANDVRHEVEHASHACQR